MQDENWLKEQALFWDSLYRIVPSGFREMQVEGQAVHPTRTESVFRDEIDFVKDCTVEESKHLHVVGERLYSLMRQSEWFKENTFADTREYFTWGHVEGTKGFWYQTQEEYLHYFLQGVFLTHSGAWRYFPGKVYMALLAKLLSISYRMPVVTDNMEHDLILKAEDIEPDRGEELYKTRLASPEDPGTQTALLYSVVFKRVGCASLDDVSPRRIIEFRRNHDEERRAFVDEVQSLAAGMKSRTYTSDAELQQYLSECAEKIDRKRRTLIAAMRGNRIDAVLRASAISAPLIAGAITGSLPEIGASVGGTLGITAILYGSRRGRRTDMNKDLATSYLLLMTQRFNARRHLSKLANIVRRGS
jgi:hypothetical protein